MPSPWQSFWSYIDRPLTQSGLAMVLAIIGTIVPSKTAMMVAGIVFLFAAYREGWFKNQKSYISVLKFSATSVVIAIALTVVWLGAWKLREKPSAETASNKTLDSAQQPPATQSTPQTETTQKPAERPRRQLRQEKPTVNAPVAIAPNGIANAAPNFGSQTVNNVPPSRALSAQRLTVFTATLGKVKGTLRVVPASSSDDVFELSQQLCTAAQNAKWANACPMSRNSGMGTEVVAKGLECYSENWGTDDAVAFQDAMKAVKLNCTYFPRAYNLGGIQILGTSGVTLLIGSPSQN